MRANWTPWLIAAAFLSPFVLAVVLRFGGWQPSHTRNFGELLQPPLSMERVSARTSNGDWHFVNAERRWSLLLRLPKECASACQQSLRRLPKVRAAMGEHAASMRFFLLDPLPAGATLQPFAFLTIGGDVPTPLELAPNSQPEVWLVDPHGYLVLRYREGFDANGLRKDLGRLFK